jgi:Lrp/AsnC family transcriptional regulator
MTLRKRELRVRVGKMFQTLLEARVHQSQADSSMLDEMDVKILRILQQDCTRSVADIGKEIGLSTTPCWRRIQKLEEAGVIQRRVAILDAARTNVGVTVFVSIKTDQHSLGWLEAFHAAVVDFPEVVEFYRMSGEVDYLLRVVVPDITAYDAFYKRLISRVEISKVSSAFAMEQIKYTTALPLDFALRPALAKAKKDNGGRRAQR